MSEELPNSVRESDSGGLEGEYDTIRPESGFIGKCLEEISQEARQGAKQRKSDVDNEGEDPAALGSVSPARAKLTGWKARFVDAMAKSGVVLIACKEARVSNSVAYAHKGKDPDFSAAWEEALESAIDLIEARATSIAVEGTNKPIYQQGRLVGYVREYDTGLQQFMLKSRRRKVYGEKLDVNVTGAVAIAAVSSGDVAKLINAMYFEQPKQIEGEEVKALPSQNQE